MAFERLVRKLTKENLWLYVISVLRSKPLYGYAVKKAISEKFHFNPSTITVYAVIYKMVREGLIEKFSEGEITYYRVTDKGFMLFEKARKFIRDMEKSIFE
ncbi:MAG: PadR family transcriptional regulator [Candidatus Methanomethylicia archaeon]